MAEDGVVNPTSPLGVCYGPKPPPGEFSSPLPVPEGMETGERAEAADILLDLFGKERQKGKFKRAESGDNLDFDLDSLSLLELTLVTLLERCLRKFSSLEKSVRSLDSAPPSALSAEVQSLRQEVAELRDENTALKTQVFEGDLVKTTRDMRENLLFHGFPELPAGEKEDTEAALRSFFVNDLKLDQGYADGIQISTSHRLGKRRSFREVVVDGRTTKEQAGPRPIVARFVIRNTRDKLKKDGNKLLRGSGNPIRMSDQFPRVVVDRRKILFPILAEKSKHHNTRLVADRLYVDNVLYIDKNTTWLYVQTDSDSTD